MRLYGSMIFLRIYVRVAARKFKQQLKVYISVPAVCTLLACKYTFACTIVIHLFVQYNSYTVQMYSVVFWCVEIKMYNFYTQPNSLSITCLITVITIICHDSYGHHNRICLHNNISDCVHHML